MIDGIVSAGAERTEHMFDSPLRFLDWLTLGVISANQNRGEVLLEEPNLYNAVNWLTMGAADTVSGAIAPEEPLSLQHWMDSYATVMAGYGAWKNARNTFSESATKLKSKIYENEELNWDNVTSKKGETRIEHINKHSTPRPDRATHGVFNGDPKRMITEAWKRRTTVTPLKDGMGGEIYNIPYKNAGYESGYFHNGAQMDYITIVVMEGTSNIITAFPSYGDYIK